MSYSMSSNLTAGSLQEHSSSDILIFSRLHCCSIQKEHYPSSPFQGSMAISFPMMICLATLFFPISYSLISLETMHTNEKINTESSLVLYCFAQSKKYLAEKYISGFNDLIARVLLILSPQIIFRCSPKISHRKIYSKILNIILKYEPFELYLSILPFFS